MILKEADDRSSDISELELLKASSHPAFHAAIEKQINRIRAGVAGERNAAHFLKRQFEPSEKVIILHDLRLGIDRDFAQIDHLVIHRVQRAAWVLETKNYSGRLSCDEHGDWTVWRGRKPQSIPSPIEQARRQCDWLRLWLEENGIKPLNRIEPVVLISPTSSVDRTKLPADSHVVKLDNFGTWWKKQTDAIGFGTALSMVGRHMLNGMSHEEFIAFGKQLLHAHVPPTFDWRARLRLPHSDVQVEHREAQLMESRAASPEDSGQDFPLNISTLHGEITITRIPDGRYALRNEKNDALIELVRNACRGKAKWNPRFRNWLIAGSDLHGVLALLNHTPDMLHRGQLKS